MSSRYLAFASSVLAVGLVLIGGAIFDGISRYARELACERAGGAFVLGTSDFTCVRRQ